MSKQMIKKHKKWLKPQLIILGRGKAEENVLAGCKSAITSGLGSRHYGCLGGPGNSCKTLCSDQKPS